LRQWHRRRYGLLVFHPIITICALMMLIIIVKLLDIVFFWMPSSRSAAATQITAKGES